MLLPHLRIAQMHLAKEVIRQSSVVVEPRQIRTTDIAHLQLLMPARSTRIAQRLQLPLPLLLLHLGQLQLVEFLHGKVDRAFLAHDLDLYDAGFDGTAQVGDLLEQGVRLPDLVGRLLQSPLRLVNPPIAVADIASNVTQIIPLEAPFTLLLLGCGGVFLLEVWLVGFGTCAQVLFGVGEEVVGTGAAQVRAADFGIGQGQLGRFVGGRGVSGEELVAHELLEQSSLLGGHG